MLSKIFIVIFTLILTVSFNSEATLKSSGYESSPKISNCCSSSSQLSLSNAAPSPQLANIIHERENGGFNWTHLAILYWLTSSNNRHASSLSATERDWVQQQINEQESSGADRDQALRELKESGIDISNINVNNGETNAINSVVIFGVEEPKTLVAE